MHFWCSIATLLGSVALFSTVQAARVEYWWNVTYANANPDGLFMRKVIGINDTWPPPVLEATINDTLVIHLHNSLKEPTSLHFHGLFQNNTGYMDGPSMVTQCPIPPGYTFTYEFLVSQYGTYWAHSHYMGQYMDGFRTPLILHNNVETYKYDEEKIITLSDWYHQWSHVNLKSFLSVQNPDGVEPIPDSGLLMDNVNASLTFEPGKTYRLRLINQSGFAMYYFSIDGHDLSVIEVDGVETSIKTVKSVYLAAAQRMSVLVSAKHTTDTNYYIHGDMDTGMFDYLPKKLRTNITIPLYYNRSHENFAPSQDIGMGSDFQDTDLACFTPMAAVEPDHHVNLTIDFQVTTDGINRGMFNNLPFFLPKTPTLNTLLSQGHLSLSPEVYGPQSRIFILKHLDMVEVVLNNLDDGGHPFHLHGHVFQIVARGQGVYHGDRTQVHWMLDNPIQRDTIQIPGNSYAIIRFRADNPGAWFFHCHIEWHLESGLALIFIEAPEVAQRRIKLPKKLIDVCKAGGIPALANGAGRQGLDLKGAVHGIVPLPEDPGTDCENATNIATVKLRLGNLAP